MIRDMSTDPTNRRKDQLATLQYWAELTGVFSLVMLLFGLGPAEKPLDVSVWMAVWLTILALSVVSGLALRFAAGFVDVSADDHVSAPPIASPREELAPQLQDFCNDFWTSPQSGRQLDGLFRGRNCELWLETIGADLYSVRLKMAIPHALHLAIEAHSPRPGAVATAFPAELFSIGSPELDDEFVLASRHPDAVRHLLEREPVLALLRNFFSRKGQKHVSINNGFLQTRVMSEQLANVAAPGPLTEILEQCYRLTEELISVHLRLRSSNQQRLLTDLVCPFCKGALLEQSPALVSCNVCGTPHHAECWAENKRCAVFGCTARTAEKQRLVVDARER